jgi:uncharacterized membrane protein
MDPVAVLLRWTHIASTTFVLGGALYARFILMPAMGGMNESERTKLGDRVAGALRPWMLGAVAAILGSGLINLLRKENLPPGYHMIFGIKALLALHVIGVAVMLGKPGIADAKRSRWLTGIVISGLIILALSAYLRALQQ